MSAFPRAPYYVDDQVTLYHGDCRDILPNIGKVDVVITDPPYSSGRAEGEFAATGNIAVSLHMASLLAPSMLVFGTSSARGIEFLRSTIRHLPHNRVLAWHRTYVNSPAAGPWRWDLVLIHVFGRGSFGRPESSSVCVSNGTKALALETGHKAPVPVGVMGWLYQPFAPGVVLDPFAGSGSVLLAARNAGGKAIGVEIEERYCELIARPHVSGGADVIFPRARPTVGERRPPRIPVVHVFTATGATNHRGESICTCGSLQHERVHALPERSEEEAQHEDRKLGESRYATTETAGIDTPSGVESVEPGGDSATAGQSPDPLSPERDPSAY